MVPFPEFEELPLIPPGATVGDSVTLSLDGEGGDSGIGEGQHSPVGGSNPCPIPKLGCPRKELHGEDRYGSKVLC